MKSKPLFIALFLSCIIVTVLSCRRNKTSKNGLNNDLEVEKPDTTIIKCISYPRYQFYIKKTSYGLLDEDKYFCTVHLNQTDKSNFLFETSGIFIDDVPVKIFDDYFLWPYWGGGNGTYSSGRTVFKMSTDTSFVLGQVCAYDDITGDDIPELYNWYLVEYGSARAFDKYENEIVTIQADTLSQSFPDNY